MRCRLVSRTSGAMLPSQRRCPPRPLSEPDQLMTLTDSCPKACDQDHPARGEAWPASRNRRGTRRQRLGYVRVGPTRGLRHRRSNEFGASSKPPRRSKAGPGPEASRLRPGAGSRTCGVVGHEVPPDRERTLIRSNGPKRSHRSRAHALSLNIAPGAGFVKRRMHGI